MAQISRELAQFFAGQLEKPAVLKLPANSGSKEWYPGAVMERFFAAVSKERGPLARKHAGRELGRQLVDELRRLYEPETVQTGISYFPKLYRNMVKGERAGIWKSVEASPGYIRFSENTPFDCLFTLGLLGGLLSGFDARGGMVKELACRNENDKLAFCEYELVWMHRIK